MVSPWVALAVAMAGAMASPQCGPTDVEAGGAVLIAAPVVLALGLLLMAGLRRVYRRRSVVAPAWRRKPYLIGIFVAAVVAIAMAIGLAHTQVFKWVAAALFLYGCSYLTLLVVAWRIWWAVDPTRAFTWAWLPVAVLQLVPALLMALAIVPGGDFIGLIWVFPGYLGIPTLVVVGLAFAEAALHRSPD